MGARIDVIGLTIEDARMVVERAVDRALGEVRRQGGPEYLLTEARTSGVDMGMFIAKAILKLKQSKEGDPK